MKLFEPREEKKKKKNNKMAMSKRLFILVDLIDVDGKSMLIYQWCGSARRSTVAKYETPS